MKKSLAAARRARRRTPQEWRQARVALIAQQRQTSPALSVRRMCRVLTLGRATYYRARRTGAVPERDGTLRRQVRRLALAWPAYGYRRLTQALRRHGVVANRKRGLRLMREEQLRVRRRRRFVGTTDSRHGSPLSPNLVPHLRVSGLAQLWIADLPSLRVRQAFGDLAVSLDAHSRRCIGWALGPSLETGVSVSALRMALRRRRVRPGLVQHSDRGGQYASATYTEVLKALGIRISMSRRGNPYANAQAESFIKTLKAEEVYLWEYADLAEAQARIGHFLENVYNRRRLHAALGYRPPAEFEQTLARTTRA
ncbi:MAG TPA: IS3 family transposase [Candidatus Binatia bacterium]|nr:IS3 family transposase [Candidatus Binatia bacterium]